MIKFFKKLFFKFTNKKKYEDFKASEDTKKNLEIYKAKYETEIENIYKKINSNEELNFSHCGHVGDIINALPVIKELSKKHVCKLYIKINTPLNVYYHKHPSNNVFINRETYDKLLPLLKQQKYIKKIDIFSGQKIDIDFDLIRKLPVNLLFDNIKYSFLITGLHPDYESKYLDVDQNNVFNNYVVIQRTFRYRNPYIDYKFLNKYDNLLFVGTRNEFEDMKKEVKNLKFYDCKDFLEIAEIIKSSKFFIANSSSCFPIAEALKVPRLLEGCPYYPAAQPHGNNAFDFYFQPHFEKWFEHLYNLKRNND